MRDKIKNLIERTETIKQSRTIDNDFQHLLSELQTLKNESIQNINDRALQDQISSLINYRPFNRLTLIEKILIKFGLPRYRIDYLDNWKDKGCYLYDIDIIQLRLTAILTKIGE